MENVEVVEVTKDNGVTLLKKTGIAIMDMTATELQDLASKVAVGLDSPDPIERDQNLMDIVVFNAKLKKFCEALEKEYKALLYSKMENLSNDGVDNIKGVHGITITTTKTKMWDFSTDETWKQLDEKVFEAESALTKAKSDRDGQETILKAMQERDPLGYDFFQGEMFKSATVKVK